MKSTTCLLLLFILVVFSACRKEKTRTYSGQLLLSKKFPTPVANHQVEVFQRGSGAGSILPLGASSALASAITDPSGYFRMRFTFGKGIFIAIPTTNNNPLVLQTSYQDTSYPSFRKENFPDSIFLPSSGPIFIGKTIDTLFIKVSLLTDLTPTDTIGLSGGTITGRLNREYTGRSGSAGSVIALDTIVNALFTEFDYVTHRFRNSTYGGRKYMTPVGYVTIWAERRPLPVDFPETDETKNEIIIFFSK